MKPVHDNSWLLWGKSCPWKEPLLSLARARARGALSVHEGRKHSVVCAGDKPGPECLKMGCDKICSAFLL